MKTKSIFLAFTSAFAILSGCANLQMNSAGNNQASSRYANLKADVDSLNAANPDNANAAKLQKQTNALSEVSLHCESVAAANIADSQCLELYSEKIPALERDLSKASRNILIGKLTEPSENKSKVQKVNECIDALGAFYINPSELLELQKEKGFHNFIPLNREGSRYKVDYEFSVAVNAEFAKQYYDMSKTWQEKCWAEVRDNDKAFIEIFTQGIKDLNKKMQAKGSRTRLDLNIVRDFSKEDLMFEATSEHITFYITIPSPIGSYYFDGKILFKGQHNASEQVLISIGRKQEQKEILLGNLLMPVIGANNKPIATFTGSTETTSEENVNGSWIWNY